MKSQLMFILLILSFISLVQAQEFPKPYNLYVNDFAHMLTPEQILELTSLFDSLKQETTAEAVFVSVNSSLPYTPQEYRTKLFNEWQIGNKENDNGLLILYSLQEKRIEVEVGYGLEGILPDSKVGRLLDQYYVPLRDSGKAAEGIISFSNAIAEEIYKNKEEVQSNNPPNPIKYSNILFILIIFLFIGTVIYLASQRKKKGFSDFIYFLIIDFLFRMVIYSIIFRGGRSSSSGGGGGFGGGGSGGGGAGR